MVRLPRVLGVPLMLLAGAAVLTLAAPASGQAVVQSVTVQVSIEGPAPHPVIRDRLVAVVESVTDRLLRGRALDQLVPLGPRLGETIADVVDRVATGYAVVAAMVQLGPASMVSVQLRPVGPLLEDVQIVTDLRTIHPQVRALVETLLQQRARPEIQALYLNLPPAAVEWAEPILEARAQDTVETVLTGFTGVVRARPLGGAAEVDITVLPRDTRIVRNIGVRFRSSSVPTMLLDQHGPAVVSMAEPVRGLPVAFAQAHREALEQLITGELAGYAPVRQYGIIIKVGLDVAETTYVTVVADSVLYRARVEAQLNIGTHAPGPSVIGHVGRVVAPRTEAFFELRLVPTPLSLEWQLGAQMEVLPAATVGASYAVVAQESTVWTVVQVGRDTAVRGEWNLRTQAFEGALSYRINEFLSGQVVGTSQGEWWLRLISNL